MFGKKGSILGSVSVLYESGAGNGILISPIFGLLFLVLCIGKRKSLWVRSCAVPVGLYGFSFSLMRLIGVTQFGPTHQVATNPPHPLTEVLPHYNIEWYDNYYFVLPDAVGRGARLNRSVHSLFADLLQVCMVHVFYVGSREKKRVVWCQLTSTRICLLYLHQDP